MPSGRDLPALHFSFSIDRFASGCGALLVCFQFRFVYSHQFMVIAVTALLSGPTLTRFDGRSHHSVMGGILVVHALSLSLLLSFFSSILVQPKDCPAFQHWAGSIHKCRTVAAAAATGMAVSTVSDVPISEVSAASDAVTVSSSMLTSAVTTSSWLRPIPASLQSGSVDLLASLVWTAVHSELSGAAGQHHLPSGPPATVGPSMVFTASVSTPPVVSFPSSSVVPMGSGSTSNSSCVIFIRRHSSRDPARYVLTCIFA